LPGPPLALIIEAEENTLRTPKLALAIVLLAVGASAQAPSDAELNAQLKKLFPSAATFSPKMGSPAHYKAFGPVAAGQEQGALLGLAYWTTELEPLERGFDGPIKMLVGLNPQGEIAGVIVADHREPYGYFSVDLPEWSKQFESKSIRDAFKVGADVDAISRATITVGSASRAIRNASRKIARAHLAPPAPPASPVAGAPAAPTAQ
jgi:transcriptional regulator of nitric oxide reductase